MTSSSIKKPAPTPTPTPGPVPAPGPASAPAPAPGPVPASAPASASAIIRGKIKSAGGSVIVTLFKGGHCMITHIKGTDKFSCDKLGTEKYSYDVFDDIVKHLSSIPSHRAPKGSGRGKSDKVGYGKCIPGTVIHNFATEHGGKKLGDSTFDPIFVLGAVLDWAGIAHNKRGYLELTKGFVGSMTSSSSIGSGGSTPPSGGTLSPKSSSTKHTP